MTRVPKALRSTGEVLERVVESVIGGFVELIDAEQNIIWIGKIQFRLTDGVSLAGIGVGMRVLCRYETRSGRGSAG